MEVLFLVRYIWFQCLETHIKNFISYKLSWNVLRIAANVIAVTWDSWFIQNGVFKRLYIQIFQKLFAEIS